MPKASGPSTRSIRRKHAPASFISRGAQFGLLRAHPLRVSAWVSCHPTNVGSPSPSHCHRRKARCRMGHPSGTRAFARHSGAPLQHSISIDLLRAYCKLPYRDRPGRPISQSRKSLCRGAHDTALRIYSQLSRSAKLKTVTSAILRVSAPLGVPADTTMSRRCKPRAPEISNER